MAQGVATAARACMATALAAPTRTGVALAARVRTATVNSSVGAVVFIEALRARGIVLMVSDSIGADSSLSAVVFIGGAFRDWAHRAGGIFLTGFEQLRAGGTSLTDVRRAPRRRRVL